MTESIEPTVAYPKDTTYFVIQHRNGKAFAVTLEPERCLYLGKGASILWQGTDEGEFASQKLAAGIEKPKPEGEADVHGQ